MVLFFGFLLSVLIVEKIHVLERVGLSFLLGFGIFTLLMFCYSSVGVKITLQSTVWALVIGISFLLVILKLLKRKLFLGLFGVVKSFSTFSSLEKIITVMIAAFGVGSLIITVYFPVNAWDSIVLYDFRAKVITEQGFYTQIANKFSYFAGYPLFTSLSHTLIYIFGGSNPQFLYSLMYLSFIFIFYSNLRVFVTRKIALIVSLLLATTPVVFDHSTFAYTNLPYTLFLAVGSIYLYVWFVKKKHIDYLILSAVLTGLSTWTRVAEPFWAVNIIILMILSIYKFKRYLMPTITYIIIFLMIKEPWNLISYYLIGNPGASGSVADASGMSSYAARLLETTLNPARMLEVTKFLYKNVILSWVPVIFLFLLVVMINLKNIFKKTSTVFLIIFILHFLLLGYATYMFSFSFVGWDRIPDSARRMAMFFIPLMVFYIGIGLGIPERHVHRKDFKKS